MSNLSLHHIKFGLVLILMVCEPSFAQTSYDDAVLVAMRPLKPLIGAWHVKMKQVNSSDDTLILKGKMNCSSLYDSSALRLELLWDKALTEKLAGIHTIFIRYRPESNRYLMAIQESASTNTLSLILSSFLDRADSTLSFSEHNGDPTEEIVTEGSFDIRPGSSVRIFSIKETWLETRKERFRELEFTPQK